jgi:hypothetical protein
MSELTYLPLFHFVTESFGLFLVQALLFLCSLDILLQLLLQLPTGIPELDKFSL